jgi:hypothetical protein
MDIAKRKEMVGARGFEPPASWSRTRRASQAALRPDDTHSGTPKKKRPEWNTQNSIALRPSLECGELAAFHSYQRKESARHGESLLGIALGEDAARLKADAVL